MLASYRRLAGDFDAAYHAHPDVPRGVLEAVSYSRSGFAASNVPAETDASELRSYGPMGLMQGDGTEFRDVLDTVSALSGIGRDRLKTDRRANIAGYAAAFSELRKKVGVKGRRIEDQVPVLRALSPHVNDPLGRGLEAIYVYSVLSFVETHGEEQGFPWERAQFDYPAILGEKMHRLATAPAISLFNGELVAGGPAAAASIAPVLEFDPVLPVEPLPLLPIEEPWTPIDPPPPPIDPVDPPASPPVNLVPPSIFGALQVEQVLSTTIGQWSSDTAVTFSHQWDRCDGAGSNCGPIAGATGLTYRLTRDELNRSVRASVTATNSAGSTTRQSAATLVIADVCGRSCGYPAGIGWSAGNRVRLSSQTPRTCSQVTGVVLHHLGTMASFDDQLRFWAGTGGRHTAAHYLIGKKGQIAQVFGELDIVSHAAPHQHDRHRARQHRLGALSPGSAPQLGPTRPRDRLPVQHRPQSDVPRCLHAQHQIPAAGVREDQGPRPRGTEPVDQSRSGPGVRLVELL